MKKIKPCPFCGGPAEPIMKKGWYKVVCRNEECPSNTVWIGKDRAIEEWNIRRKPVKEG